MHGHWPNWLFGEIILLPYYSLKHIADAVDCPSMTIKYFKRYRRSIAVDMHDRNSMVVTFRWAWLFLTKITPFLLKPNWLPCLLSKSLDFIITICLRSSCIISMFRIQLFASFTFHPKNIFIGDMSTALLNCILAYISIYHFVWCIHMNWYSI